MDTDRLPRMGTIAAIVVIALIAIAGVGLAVSFLSDPAPVDGELPIGVEDGPEIILVTDGTEDVNLEDVGATAADLFIQTEQGEIWIDGDDGATATIQTADIEGDWTQATSIESGFNWIYLDPADKQRVGIRGDIDALQFRDIGIDDSETDLTIVGTEGGTVDLHIEDLPSNEHLVLYDADTDRVLGDATTDNDGTLETNIELESEQQSVELRSFDTFDDPQLLNPQPIDRVTNMPEELSIDIEADAHPVDLTFYLEDEEITTETVTENTTVTAEIDPETLGTFNWSVSATDALGNTDEIHATFETPQDITLREEHEPTNQIDDATVTVRFFTVDGDIVIREETEDGTIDMTGLPDTNFIAFIQSEEHYDRTIYIDSIFEQEDMFLLNSTTFDRATNDAVTSRFVYTDLTGQFPRSDTTLQVQRAIDINDNGTSEFMTVAGDFWGAGGDFETTLEHGERYQLFVENQETGATDPVGTHIPTEDLIHEIRTSGLVQEAANATGIYANAQLNTSDNTIDVIYHDPVEETEELQMTVTNGSAEPLVEETIEGPLGTYRQVIQLDEEHRDEDITVTFNSNRHSSSIPIGHGEINLPMSVPSWIMTLLMAMVVTFVGALYGPRTALLGAWSMVFVAGGAAMFGWAFSGSSVLVAGLVAVGATIYSETRADR